MSHYIAMVVLPPEFADKPETECMVVADRMIQQYTEHRPWGPTRVIVSAAERANRVEWMRTQARRVAQNEKRTDLALIAEYVGANPQAFSFDTDGNLWTNGKDPAAPLHDYANYLTGSRVALSDALAFADENYGGVSYIVTWDGTMMRRHNRWEYQPRESVYFAYDREDDLGDRLDAEWATQRNIIPDEYPAGCVAVFFDTHR